MAAWLDEAKKWLGTKEYPGAPSNPVIMKWATRVGRYLGIRYDGDHVPWCGLFATYCVVEAGLTPPSISVRASEWAKWGVALDRPTPGAILVFSREGGGHVGFYVSEDADAYHVLGGNQSDKVCLTRIAKNRCTAIRWPSKPLPKTGPVLAAFTGSLSTNEA